MLCPLSVRLSLIDSPNPVSIVEFTHDPFVVMSAIKKLFHRESKDLSNTEKSPTNQRFRLRKSTGDANVRQQFLDDTAAHNDPGVRDFGNGDTGGRSASNVRRLSLRGVGRSSRNEMAGPHDGPPQLANPMAISQPSRDLSQEMAALDLNRNNREYCN